jgi:hypothetical protein
MSWSGSSLHLDDLQENHSGLDQISGHRICEESIGSKQRRLFKEYVACCRGALTRSGNEYLHNKSFSNLSICDKELGMDIPDPSESAGTEYSSFLPKSSGAPLARSWPAPTTAKNTCLFCHFGRDVPVSSPSSSDDDCRNAHGPGDQTCNKLRTLPPPPSPTISSASLSRCSAAAAGPPAAAAAAAAQIPSRRGSAEVAMYRAQLAAALGGGRKVWF